MSPAARIILSLACGFGTLGFLCAGLGGAGKDARANTLLIGLAAVCAAVTLYFATAREAKKPNKRAKRSIATPSAAAEYEEELAAPERAAPALPRKTLEMRDFDLASLTPAGWGFGASGVLLFMVGAGLLGVAFGGSGNTGGGRTVTKVLGFAAFGLLMVYFTFGSRWLMKQGYPVFRGAADRKRKPAGPSTERRGLPPEPPGLPPRRPPRRS